jgi:C-terminal processing protease CtpA/Prc
MKKIITPVMLPVIILLSTCHIFLGPDADTGPEEVLYNLWKDFDEIHAYIDIRMNINKSFNNWDDVYKNYSAEINVDTDNLKLFNVCSDMLSELKDPHVGLYAPDKYSSGYEKDKESRSYEEEARIYNLAKTYLKDEGISSDDRIFLYGTFSSAPRIGYIRISSFVDTASKTADIQDWVKNIDHIIESLANTESIIIDLRYNRGGSALNMEYIAARFITSKKDYMKSSFKNGPGHNDFSTPVICTIKPDGKKYTKPIALLTNENSTSAAEWFVMALRTENHVTHVGTTTCGAFSARVERPMINGWYYSISPEMVTDMDGNCYEGTGMAPVVELTDDPEEGTGPEWSPPNTDIQLERTLDWLIQQL